MPMDVRQPTQETSMRVYPHQRSVQCLKAIQLVTALMVMQRLKYVVALHIAQAHQLISVGQCMTKQPMR